MKQKIVVQLHLNSDKDRSKAMKIASVRKGVNSVAIRGEAKDQVEVIGDEVDSVELTDSLRKKVSRSASLVSVEEVKAKEEEAKEEKSQLAWTQAQPISYYPQYYPPSYYMCQTVCDPNPPVCSFLW